ncbi:MAG: PqqD family peptide modification chaperone [Phycisphaeraceae bacterium]|nr:MAG: PqqD family peptide modification chaperone [Phycisphaeraceae bacterium]
MSVDRPTFHESWQRVVGLKPRLRACVDIHRQHFRGQLWHVLQDPSNNQFFRLNEHAYRFVSLLDGDRTVGEAWRLCGERHGDGAPTQGEVIQLLGQLYNANLLYAETPGDVEVMFRRQKKRVAREVRGYLTNLLFIRIPLLDPDRFLDRWVGAVGWMVGPVGAVLWIAMLLVGGFFLLGRFGDLFSEASGVLAPANLPLLYIAFVVTKLLHELGHGFACKKFGRDSGSGGEVHVLGIMLLVFMPVPYVDASSSWAFRSKWKRITVGAGGMIVELACAAVAAIVWANTAPGTVVNALAYNVIFIAGVSTILFNGNPLLRFDGYYILSDLLELPNLHQRSRDYVYYLVKRYIWNVERANSPAHAPGERPLLFIFCIAVFVYRMFIYVAIIWFVATQFFLIGILLAIAAIVTWVFVPIGKLLRFLAVNPEIDRVRARAVVSTVGFVLLVLGVLGMIPVPDRIRAEGVVEPTSLTVVYMGADGFVSGASPSGRVVNSGDEPLVSAENLALERRLDALRARRDGLAARRRMMQQEDIALAQIAARQIEAIEEQIERVEMDIAALRVRPTIAGVWISPDSERLTGAWVGRGDALGLIAGLDETIVRAVANQRAAAQLRNEASERVEMRIRGRPQALVEGVVTRYLEAGQDRLPSAALGYSVGGATPVDMSDPTKASERFFEIRIAPEPGAALMPGQRVVVRFDLPAKPLLKQWIRNIRQIVQGRLNV